MRIPAPDISRVIFSRNGTAVYAVYHCATSLTLGGSQKKNSFKKNSVWIIALTKEYCQKKLPGSSSAQGLVCAGMIIRGRIANHTQPPPPHPARRPFPPSVKEEKRGGKEREKKNRRGQEGAAGAEGWRCPLTFTSEEPRRGRGTRKRAIHAPIPSEEPRRGPGEGRTKARASERRRHPRAR